jgi:ubiquinone/menaquinone biosynthesis C-methylase UbiE
MDVQQKSTTRRAVRQFRADPPPELPHFQQAMRTFFDDFAAIRERWRPRGYHSLVDRYYRYYIPRGARVLEIGSGTGDLLAALEPSIGVGVDLSPEMTDHARRKHTGTNLRFVTQTAEELDLDEEPFDYIILSDTLSYLNDILAALRSLRRYCHARTRIVCNFYSRLWEPLLGMLERVGLKYPQPLTNWVSPEDVRNLLQLAGFEVVSHERRILLPARVPLLAPLLNRVVAAIPGFRSLCLTNWMVARLPKALPADLGVSVVCACRNESGNIAEIVRRFPAFQGPAELIFVEGNSTDNTFERCREVAAENPQCDISVYRQTGKGKGDAVRMGFAKAKYDIVMILDADMTVAPEDLPGFVDVLLAGKCEFVNGSRLVYPMQNRAMRFLNLVGNRFFAKAFSFLLGQPIKDTLCGTKVLLKSDYDRLVAGRGYFGDFDPFGDFDLIFGAAKLGLRIADYPVRYRARVFGETQISRFRHGLMLLRMCGVALWKLRLL